MLASICSASSLSASNRATGFTHYFSVATRSERRTVTITWTSRPGKTYTVDSAADLERWTELTDGFPAEEGETTTLTVEEIPAETLELYRRVREE